MTTRLFDDDSRLFEFSATVVSCTPAEDDSYQVVLNQTAFYPEGGGQPADRGALGLVDVLDVQESAELILHKISGPLTVGNVVEGRVDALRRQDFMEQHSGQHLCSAVFWRELTAATTAVHLGDEISTIDFARPDLTPDELERLEIVVSREIASDRAVKTRRVTADDLPRDMLRRPPAREFADYRLVEIEGLDLACCCGTHLSSTGELRLVKLLGVERRRGGIRVSFLAGERAIRHYRQCWNVLDKLSVTLSKPPLDVEIGLAELQARNLSLAERVKSLDQEMRAFRAAELSRSAIPSAGGRLVMAVLTGYTPETLSELACELAIEPDLLILLGSESAEGDRSFLAFTRGEEAGSEEILHDVFQVALRIVEGRGGGRGNLRRGAGIHPERLAEALEAARASICW